MQATPGSKGLTVLGVESVNKIYAYGICTPRLNGMGLQRFMNAIMRVENSATHADRLCVSTSRQATLQSIKQ